MIGKITTRLTLSPQPVDSQVEERIYTPYLINTDCIIEMKDQSPLALVNTYILYKFNVYEDDTPEFAFTANDTVLAIQTLADATPASPKIALSVFEEAQSFNQAASITPVTWYFNVSDIVWAEDDPTGCYCRIWIMKGGNKIVPYIVDHNIDQIVDRADTGTTTTTTTTTTAERQ